MNFIHINLESLSSETDKHLIFSKTKKKKNEKYTYLFNHTINEYETTLLIFLYKIHIKKNHYNKTNLFQSSSTYTQFMRPTAISPK